MTTFEVRGYTNPVKAIAACLRSMLLPIDEPAFEREAKLASEWQPGDPGMVIHSYGDLMKLCFAAHVNISFDTAGRLTITRLPVRPTVARLKKDANRVKKQQGVRHHEALDLVARQWGFQNFIHAKRELENEQRG